MSKIRIQNDQGEDLVRIDLNTGEVDVLASGSTGTAAETWWKTVAATYEVISNEHKRTFKDLVLHAAGKGSEHDGNIILHPGEGEEGASGGNVRVVAKTPCPECFDNPQGVLLLDKYHPCTRCGGPS